MMQEYIRITGQEETDRTTRSGLLNVWEKQITKRKIGRDSETAYEDVSRNASEPNNLRSVKMQAN